METIKNILEKDYKNYKVKDILKYLLIFEVAKYTIKTLHWRYRNIQLRNRAAQYLENRNKQIYKFDPVDPELAAEVLELDVSQIRDRLLSGKLTSV